MFEAGPPGGARIGKPCWDGGGSTSMPSKSYWMVETSSTKSNRHCCCCDSLGGVIGGGVSGSPRWCRMRWTTGGSETKASTTIAVLQHGHDNASTSSTRSSNLAQPSLRGRMGRSASGGWPSRARKTLFIPAEGSLGSRVRQGLRPRDRHGDLAEMLILEI